MEFDADLDLMLADFGVSATVGSTTVKGIFDEPSAMAFGYVEGGKPTFTCKESAVPGIKRGDALTINGKAYIVGGAPRPDGTGLTVIPLELNQ